MKTLIVVPARYKSSRFPGKPLKKINNKEMILWVLDICKKILNDNIKLIVATDNKKIFNFVKKNNYNSIMTSSKCLTGTDRVAEVAKKINADIYVNVQGDEPLIKPKDIIKIINSKKKNFEKVICGYTQIKKNENEKNKNIPKIILNKKEELIYISRVAIPASKNSKIYGYNFLKQVCIYAFNKNELNEFNSRKKSILESIEDIEIIRFLESGKKVQMVKLNSGSYAVDTIKDLKNVERIIKKI
jgi:3-deoxy-manno-octulosonate cytidylyltransferase (CMP-KDO synthetase)